VQLAGLEGSNEAGILNERIRKVLAPTRLEAELADTDLTVPDD
jgi:hypothetical protein